MTRDQQQTPEEYDNGKGYSSSQDVALAIVGAGLANAIALLAIKEPFTLWNMIVGLIILCILYVYAPAPTSRNRLNVAYAAIWSISFLTTVGVIFNVIFSGLGGHFPDYGSKDFAPFPTNLNVFTNQMSDTFTPFNIYDGTFFLTWLAIFLICLLFLLRKRNKNRTQMAALVEQPKPEPETPQTHEGGTPATSGHLSGIPKSGVDEVH